MKTRISKSEISQIICVRKAQFILRSINQHNRHKFAHFDQQFVQKLLDNPQIPELLKISPLTTREWQVLGLIYSGYSNEQISQELIGFDGVSLKYSADIFSDERNVLIKNMLIKIISNL